MEKLHLRPGHTLAACFVGYITQAIINNFAPLLFVTFNTTYGTSLTLIGAMITINFGVQLLVDLLAARFVDKIGYRPCIVAELFRSGAFWFFVVLMICSGSCEQAVSQWASAFAESGLGVSKTWGDLLGPCMFAVMMGVSRVVFSKSGEKLKIHTALLIAALCCIVGYVLCAFSPFAWLGLIGCGIVGLSVGIMWPGTFSFASARMPRGGTALFAMLAFAGDIGCMAGPSAVGAISDAFAGDLHIGIAFGLVFPVLMAVVLLAYRAKKHEPQLLRQK